jgi:hypothetical protein
MGDHDEWGRLIKQLAAGTMTKERYDFAVARLEAKAAARAEFAARKGELTIIQRLDILETLLDLH